MTDEEIKALSYSYIRYYNFLKASLPESMHKGLAGKAMKCYLEAVPVNEALKKLEEKK